MSVNYLIEINALDDWELTHPLTATAYKVMRKLLYLANKERFPERMTVPNGVLMSLTGCSEDSLIKARNQLIQAGLITYKGQKKLTPLYFIKYFSLNPVYNPKIQGYEQGIKQGYEQGIKQGYEQGIKQGTYINKTLEDNNDEAQPAKANAIRRMAESGIPLGPSQYEVLRDFSENGITDEMLGIALDEAIEHNALNFAYIRKVVDSWICSGIKSAADIEAYKASFKKAAEMRTARPVRMNAPEQQMPAPRFFSERWASE